MFTWSWIFAVDVVGCDCDLPAPPWPRLPPRPHWGAEQLMAGSLCNKKMINLCGEWRWSSQENIFCWPRGKTDKGRLRLMPSPLSVKLFTNCLEMDNLFKHIKKMTSRPHSAWNDGINIHRPRCQIPGQYIQTE